MAWKETDAMNERGMMIGEWLRGEETVSGLARKYGVSRKSVYKWIGRHAEGGWGGLGDRSRAALSHPNAVDREVERLLLELKAGKPLWGAPKLRCKLLEALGEGKKCPAESTVSEILRRHGLSGVRGKARRRAVPSQAPMEHCAGANQVWCADYKGWFRTGDGRKCTPLTITDGHSRYLLHCRGLGGGTGTLAAKPQFIAAFREFGLPEAMRTDNGPPFASCGLGGLSELSVWWMLLGIRLERIEPGKPQQNGRHERMHRTLKDSTANPPRANLREQQAAFDAFREEYNVERPHEALGQKPPATCYERSAREYPVRLPKQAGYPDEWEKRRVRGAGQMKWKGKDVRVSDALQGLEIGLEPVAEGRWAVYFETVKLGIFDERKVRVMSLKAERKRGSRGEKSGQKEEGKV
jgi:putative transposase